MVDALPLALLLAACEAAPEPLPHAARPVVEIARWEVFDGDAHVGTVRQLEIHDPQGPQAFYRIEDRRGRWLGHATTAGRFTRRVPFRDEEQDLGVWSLARGTALLVEAKAEVRLQPVALDADMRRR